MKKLLALFAALLLLAGCGMTAVLDEYETPDSVASPPLHMAVNPTDEFMAQFANTHEYQCRNVSRNIANAFTVTLVFWTDEPLHDFSYVRHNQWRGTDERFFFGFESQFTIGDLLPGDAFVLQGRFIYGNQMSYPGAGFAFTNQAGEQQHMAFQVNPYGNVPHVSMHLVESTLPNWPWCDICDVYCQMAYEVALWPSSAPLHMTDSATDALMQTFSAVHELTHRVDWPTDYTPPLVFWADEPLRDVSYIALGWPETGGGPYAGQTLATLPQLLPNEALVLHMDVSHSTPWQGLAFVDAGGVQRHMIIGRSWAGGCIPHIGLSPFENNPPQ